MFITQKISRKDFLRTSGLALTLPLLSKMDALAKPIRKVGLQLYTLRSEVSKGPEGTLKKVAEIGYKEVEAFGYANGKFFGKTPAEMKLLLNGWG